MIERACIEYAINALWQVPLLAGSAWLLNGAGKRSATSKAEPFPRCADSGAGTSGSPCVRSYSRRRDACYPEKAHSRPSR
jgi:hypothetical protein